MPKALNLLNEKFGRLTVIEKAENYKNRTAWICQCECGKIITVTTKNLRNGSVRSCGCLKRKSLIGQKFGQLTVIKATDERRHGSVVWECICDCGNITYATTEGLRVGDNISCGCKNKAKEKFSQSYKVDLTNKQYGLLTVLGATDMRTNNGNQIWKCQCQCGNITYVSTNHLQTGNTKSCGCLQGKSYGEKRIKQILADNNINFKSEYIFPELPNRRYDFAVLNEDNTVNYLIEFDGEQHYFEIPHFKLTLKQQQDIDLEKTNYAKSLNIPLIRIPYWKRNIITINDLRLNNELSQ